jgi:hypothetical protein
MDETAPGLPPYTYSPSSDDIFLFQMTTGHDRSKAVLIIRRCFLPELLDDLKRPVSIDLLDGTRLIDKPDLVHLTRLVAQLLLERRDDKLGAIGRPCD